MIQRLLDVDADAYDALATDVLLGGAFQANRRPAEERRGSSINHEACVLIENACHFSRRALCLISIAILQTQNYPVVVWVSKST